MKKVYRFSRTSFVVMSLILWISGSMAGAFYLESERQIVDQPYEGIDQSSPSVAHDMSGNVHFIWLDERTDASLYYPPYIFHRKLMYQSSTPDPSSPLFSGAACDVAPGCDFKSPEITFGTDIGYGAAFAGSDGLFYSAKWNNTAWSNTAAPSNNLGMPPHMSITCPFQQEEYYYLAYSDYGTSGTGVYVLRYNNSLDYWDQSYFFSPPSGDYHNVDIASDSNGYIYVTYEDMESPQNLFIHRTQNPLDITSWGPARLVTQSSISMYMNPAVAARFDTQHTYVAVTWTLSQDFITCTCETDGDWVAGGPFTGNSSDVNDQIASYPDNSDVVFGPQNEIYVVWTDSSVAGTADNVMASVSYNLAESFLADQMLSNFSYPNYASFPRISVSATTGDVAVVYEEVAATGPQNVYYRLNTSDVVDPCETTDNWDVFNDVTISTAESHDPGGQSYQFSNNTCDMEKNYSPQNMKGSISLYFYDDMSTNYDFYVGIEGKDAQGKGGVVRLLGVKGTVTDVDYVKNNELDKAWVSTGRARSQGWHHLIYLVGEDGLKIYLDPEIVGNEAPLSDTGGEDFITFSKMTIHSENRSKRGKADVYYVDDIRITTKVDSTTISVPTTSKSGLFLLIVIITAILSAAVYKR